MKSMTRRTAARRRQRLNTKYLVSLPGKLLPALRHLCTSAEFAACFVRLVRHIRVPPSISPSSETAMYKWIMHV